MSYTHLKELLAVSKRMRTRGIKILNKKRDNSLNAYVVKYKCSGYDQEFMMIYGHLKTCVEVR